MLERASAWQVYRGWCWAVADPGSEKRGGGARDFFVNFSQFRGLLKYLPKNTPPPPPWIRHCWDELNKMEYNGFHSCSCFHLEFAACWSDTNCWKLFPWLPTLVPNATSMLSQRLWRWGNIEAALGRYSAQLTILASYWFVFLRLWARLFEDLCATEVTELSNWLGVVGKNTDNSVKCI